jgi:hypothetical protein
MPPATSGSKELHAICVVGVSRRGAGAFASQEATMTGTLSFASLLFAAAQGAQAGQIAADHDAASAPELAARWTHEVKNGELHVTLRVKNTGDEAVDVMLARGKMPGTDLQADLGGVALQRLFTDEEMSGQMSRRGPMPTYAAVAVEKEILAGTYRFQLPEGYTGGSIRLEATVRTGDENVTLRTEVNAPPSV